MRRERITITIRSDVLRKLDTVMDGEKIRNRSNAIETIVLEKFKQRILQKAIILGAGKDIELNGKVINKLLLPLKEGTLVEKNIKTLKKFGIKEFVLVVGKWKSAVEKVLSKRKEEGIKINYHEEYGGTEAVLRHIKQKLKETFFMANGDIVLDIIDIEDLYLFHKKHRGAATIAVATAADSSRLGSIFMKGNLITDFREKITHQEKQSQLINGGGYIMEPQVCDLVPEEFSMLEEDVFPKMASEKKLFGLEFGKNWVHLDDKTHYEGYLKSLESK